MPYLRASFGKRKKHIIHVEILGFTPACNREGTAPIRVHDTCVGNLGCSIINGPRLVVTGPESLHERRPEKMLSRFISVSAKE